MLNGTKKGKTISSWKKGFWIDWQNDNHIDNTAQVSVENQREVLIQIFIKAVKN